MEADRPRRGTGVRAISIALFFVAFAAWSWLEFVDPQPASEGLRAVLFWAGMALLALSGAMTAARRVGREDD